MLLALSFLQELQDWLILQAAHPAGSSSRRRLIPQVVPGSKREAWGWGVGDTQISQDRRGGRQFPAGESGGMMLAGVEGHGAAARGRAVTAG